MAPELRDGRISVFAKRIMRKPRTLHCPYCDGKVLFTRNEEHLDAKNCPHCGMRVERREWPEKLYDPMPILRTKPGGPDSMKIETADPKEPAAKKDEKEKKV
jgi:DNA-directed RNA polymerase subunit RPC12/RpoP